MKTYGSKTWDDAKAGPARERVDADKEIDMQITVTTHDSTKSALEFMNRPEQLAPFDAYIADVKARAEAGLSPEDLAQFRVWWVGGPTNWDAVSRPAYNAIMQAISEGCG